MNPKIEASAAPAEVLQRLVEHIEEHGSRLRRAPLHTTVTHLQIQARLQQRYGFQQPMPIESVFEDMAEMLWEWSEHARNPMHFGLTRPNVDVASIVADALAALYDPNLATWNFSPAACEIERYTLNFLAQAFGFGPGEGACHFTSGGQEANHTAVAVALTDSFPEFESDGLCGLKGRPVFYLSQEGHHSFDKVAHSTGLGRAALRRIPVDDELRMDAAALSQAVEQDRKTGRLPFLIAATAGTTNAGAIDPLDELADIARSSGLWLHVDAAWGGAAALSECLRHLLKGIERADSITFDAHKWLSVPVGAGAFFCRRRAAVEATFAVQADYVPPQASGRIPPYMTSMQWSRRFIGLKVFMMLAVRGMPEIARRIERQAELARYLADLLAASGWRILNRPDLAVVCFSHPRIQQGTVSAQDVVRRVKEGGIAWISRTVLGGRTEALRASVTNFQTRSGDIERLVQALAEAAGCR